MLFVALLVVLALAAGCAREGDSNVARDASAEACIPDCNGKTCGSDGCGDICGVCLPFESCNERFTCLPWPCARMQWAAAAGCCVGEVLLYCSGGAVMEEDCSGFPHCGWNSDQGLYLCNTAGGEEPTGKHKKTCP
jgi:hypothetical protein